MSGTSWRCGQLLLEASGAVAGAKGRVCHCGKPSCWWFLAFTAAMCRKGVERLAFIEAVRQWKCLQCGQLLVEARGAVARANGRTCHSGKSSFWWFLAFAAATGAVVAAGLVARF